MRMIIALCLLLFSLGAGAQVRIENGVVLGLSENEVVEHGGETKGGECFVITRPVGDNWDSSTFTGLYIGRCDSSLEVQKDMFVRKGRNGGISFEFNVHSTPKGPMADVIFIASILTPYPSVYKMTPITYIKFKKGD